MRQLLKPEWLFLLCFLITGYATAWGATYKLTQVTTVAAGNKYVFVESGHALTTVDSSKKAISSTTTYSTTGLSGTESYVWTLETAKGGFYMKLSTGKYLKNTSGSDMATDSPSSYASTWVFDFTGDIALISNKDNSNRFIGNNSSNAYKAYAVNYDGSRTEPHDFTVYLLEEETEAVKRTITCHIGDNTTAVERNDGAALNLETPSEIGGMSFAGWSSSDDAKSPSWVSNSATVTDDMELYAMFGLTTGSTAYWLVEAGQTDWSGDYLLVSSETAVANGKTGDTSLTAVNPSEKPVDHKYTTSTGDNYKVTIEAIDANNPSAGYVLKTQDGKYNYCTGASGDISVTTTKATAAGHPLAITFNSSANIAITAHNTWNMRYNSGSFRFYDGTTGDNVYLYKKSTTATTYSLGRSKTITITAAKYATYCAEEELDFSGTGVNVYTAKVTDGVVRLTEIAGGIVPGNTGFIAYKDVTEPENVVVPVRKTTASVTDNELVGTTEKTEIPWQTGDKYNYILQKDSDGTAKFFKATGGNLIANRAYLSTTYMVTDSRGLDIVFDQGETTGVKAMDGSEQTIHHCFDLQGRKVVRPVGKGLYIVNGKKVVR